MAVSADYSVSVGRVDIVGSTALAYNVSFQLPSQQGVRQTAILVILTHTHRTIDTRFSKLLARAVPTHIYTCTYIHSSLTVITIHPYHYYQALMMSHSEPLVLGPHDNIYT